MSCNTKLLKFVMPRENSRKIPKDLNKTVMTTKVIKYLISTLNSINT